MTQPDSALTLSYSSERLTGSTWCRQVEGRTHSIKVTSRLRSERRGRGLSVRTVDVECLSCGATWSQRVQGIVRWKFRCRACHDQHTNNPHTTTQKETHQ